MLPLTGPGNATAPAPIVANRLDASSQWLPGWSASQDGLPLAAVPSAGACAAGRAQDSTSDGVTAGSRYGMPSMDAPPAGVLGNLTGRIALVAGGPLPSGCTYADIIACALALR